MFSQDLIARLAAELHESEKSRVQVEHFSRRFPGMTIEDGYAVSRACLQAHGAMACNYARVVGCMTRDGRVAYPVRDDIPVLLEEQGILLAQLDGQ